MRVAFVCSRLYRYNVELFRLASNSPGFHVTVLQMAEREHFRDWQYSLEGLDVKTIGSTGIPFITSSGSPEAFHFNPKLVRELREGGYDAFVTASWTQGFTLMTLAAAHWLHKPAILWEMSVAHSASPLKRAFMPIIRSMMRSYDGYTAGSTKCRDYLISLGCEAAKIHLVRHPIDYEYFGQVLTPDEKNDLRHELGLSPTVPLVLFVGQYIERKGVVELVEAWHLLQQANPLSAHLVLIGSGELEPYLQDMITRHNLKDSVTLKGYVQHNELKKWYGAADLFVMPSRYEAFGAVAGEALCSGLPVITTTAAGAEPDLIRDGRNGIVIPPGNVAALADALKRLAFDTTLRARMTREAYAAAQEYATPGIAAEFVQAVTTISQSYASRSK